MNAHIVCAGVHACAYVCVRERECLRACVYVCVYVLKSEGDGESPRAGVTGIYRILSLSPRYWNLKSGPHDCTASTS